VHLYQAYTGDHMCAKISEFDSGQQTLPKFSCSAEPRCWQVYSCSRSLPFGGELTRLLNMLPRNGTSLKKKTKQNGKVEGRGNFD
jgi:hypothetical protein